MEHNSHTITGKDVEKIYHKIESEQKRSFFVQVSDKQKEIPNHIPEKVAKFYDQEISHGRDKTKLEFDAKVAHNIAQGLY